MSNTNNNFTSLSSLAQRLKHIDFTELALQTGLVKRVTPGFCPKAYCLAMLKSVASGDGSLRKIASNVASSVGDKSLSKQALHYRVGVNAVNFFKKISVELLNSATGCDQYDFHRVLLQDSTQLRLPKQNNQHYRGTGNGYGKKSTAKVDLISDLISGDTLDIELSNGTK